MKISTKQNEVFQNYGRQKVGRQISILRKSKSLTQNDLGERLGVTFQSVSKWELGETLPDTAILVDLATILETTVDYILQGGEKTTSSTAMLSAVSMRE